MQSPRVPGTKALSPSWCSVPEAPWEVTWPWQGKCEGQPGWGSWPHAGSSARDSLGPSSCCSRTCLPSSAFVLEFTQVLNAEERAGPCPCPFPSPFPSRCPCPCPFPFLYSCPFPCPCPCQPHHSRHRLLVATAPTCSLWLRPLSRWPPCFPACCNIL